MSKLQLRQLADQDEVAFLKWVQDWKDEDPLWATFAWKPGMTHQDHLAELENQKDKTKIAKDRVPATMFYGFVENTIVGRINIRHELNDHLLQRGGHLGYAVSPKFRKQGYATQMFRLGLQKCRDLGLSEILITCTDENVASWRVIEKFGSQLENRILDDEDKKLVRRYWLKPEQFLKDRSSSSAHNS